MEELLQRYIRGEVSEEERRKVAQWIDQTPENMREFLALRKLYDISLWNVQSKEIATLPNQLYRFRRLVIEVAKIAAILLIGFFGARQLLSQDSEMHMQTIHVPAGQRAELTLSDGTLVWLNSRSTLKFPDRFSTDSRNVELDGEGYFDVKHDENAPFTVHTEKYAIYVLGTEFNVKAYNGSPFFETALLRGSVEITAPESQQKLRLRPDEIASVSQGQLVTSQIPDLNYFKWKEGLFCFENETIGALIEKLQLYYDIRIEVQNTKLLQSHYSGKFRIKDGIEHVLRVLQLKHKFTYTKDEENNLIVIK